MHYTHSEEQLSYWRTYTGVEVDVVIGDARVAIEIKSVEEVMTRHLKGLKAFGEEHNRVVSSSLWIRSTVTWATLNVSMS